MFVFKLEGLEPSTKTFWSFFLLLFTLNLLPRFIHSVVGPFSTLPLILSIKQLCQYLWSPLHLIHLTLLLEFSFLLKRHIKKCLPHGSFVASHPSPCITKNICIVHCHSNDNFVRYKILSSKFFFQYLKHIIPLSFCLWYCYSEVWYQNDSCSFVVVHFFFLWKILKCSFCLLYA